MPHPLDTMRPEEYTPLQPTLDYHEPQDPVYRERTLDYGEDVTKPETESVPSVVADVPPAPRVVTRSNGRATCYCHLLPATARPCGVCRQG